MIWGSQRVWTKGRKKRLGRTKVPISVWVGEPLAVAEDDDMVAVTETLRARMTDLLHEAQETYPEKPSGPDDTWWQPARLGGSAPTPDEALQLDRDERRARIAAAKKARDEGRAT